MRRYEFELFADYHQFYLQDESAVGDLSAAWTEQAMDRWAALAPGTIGVRTARDMDVPVVIEVYDEGYTGVSEKVPKKVSEKVHELAPCDISDSAPDEGRDTTPDAIAPDATAPDTTSPEPTSNAGSDAISATVPDTAPDTAPNEEYADWDRVFECSITVNSGRLVVAGCTDYFPDAARLEVVPGDYRARIHYGDLESLEEDGLDGDDHYKIVLWPAPQSESVTLK